MQAAPTKIVRKLAEYGDGVAASDLPGSTGPTQSRNSKLTSAAVLPYAEQGVPRTLGSAFSTPLNYCFALRIQPRIRLRNSGGSGQRTATRTLGATFALLLSVHTSGYYRLRFGRVRLFNVRERGRGGRQALEHGNMFAVGRGYGSRFAPCFA